MVVIEDGGIGSGQTGRRRPTSSMRSTIASSISSGITASAARGWLPRAIRPPSTTSRASSSRERIACDFLRLDGYLFCAAGHDEKLLDRELEATHRAGLHNVARIGRAPISFDTGPCLRFPNQAQFHPLKYLAGLAEAIERAGGRIYTGTHATKIEGGAGASVGTPGGTVRAGSIVVATNVPVNDRVVVHTKQAPYMTYVIGARVPRGAVTTALYWDTGDPYHYIRLVTAIDSDPRSADRRRRGSQERTGRRHRRTASAARTLGARAFPDDG